MKKVSISSVDFANDLPLGIIGGMNVLESADLAMEVASAFVEATSKLKIPYVFKASFDKANRTSYSSYRGPGIEKGLQLLADISAKFSVPVITDVHERSQASMAAKVCDALQLPAFLARQTDLVQAMAETGKPINIKKPQFISHAEMASIAQKFAACGNDKLMLCERGNCFGYNNLVVDILGFGVLKEMSYPVIFDVTHALQLPGARLNDGGELSAGGRGAQVFDLAKAAVVQGIAGLFIEVHPDPVNAKCDGPCALPLKDLPKFLEQMQELDNLIKNH